MNNGKIYVLLLAVLPAVFTSIDYCRPSLCDEGKKHIACGNNGEFASICERPEIINITKDYQKHIVRVHNSLRNEIAKGFQHFPPAARMATMVWNDELARLAELNVKQCEVRHDQCRNTPRFSHVGQNVGTKRWRESKVSIFDFINGKIRAWFNEYKYCPLDVIKSFRFLNGTACSRFTAMMQDKSSHLGCAILRSHFCGYTQQLMTCNYAYDNIIGAPVYSDGQTASQCTTGTNRILNSLCSVREIYN